MKKSLFQTCLKPIFPGTRKSNFGYPTLHYTRVNKQRISMKFDAFFWLESKKGPSMIVVYITFCILSDVKNIALNLWILDEKMQAARVLRWRLKFSKSDIVSMICSWCVKKLELNIWGFHLLLCETIIGFSLKLWGH